MKKILSLLMCAALLLSALFAFAGCGGEKKADETAEETVVGTWRLKLELGDALVEAMATYDESIAEYMQFDGFGVDLLFTFGEDGTCTVRVDEETVDSAMEALEAGFADSMELILEATFSEMGYSEEYSMSEVLEILGLDIDTLVDEYMAEISFDEIFDAFEMDGQYKVVDNRLYTTSDKDTPVVEDVSEYFIFTLEGDVLTFTDCISQADGGETEDGIMDSLYPMVLKRVK